MNRKASWPAIFFVFICVFLLTPFAFAEENNKTPNTPPYSYSTTVSWSTDKPSTSQVEYGKTVEYGHFTRVDGEFVTAHRIVIGALEPATLYHYRVISKDNQGNKVVGPDATFRTPDDSLASNAIKISDIDASVIVAGGAGIPATEQLSDGNVEPSDKITGSTAADDSSVTRNQPTKRDTQLIKKESTIQEVLIEKGGLLLSKGKWQIEPSFTYAHISTNRVAIAGTAILPILVVGEISADKVRRDILIHTETLRYGLLDSLQWEVNVPYMFQHERVIDALDDSESTHTLEGIGDIQTGLFYHWLSESGGRPDILLGVSVKSDTGESPYNEINNIGIGTGHWATKASLVWVKTADPAILFGGLGYTWNMERDIGGYGEVDPGDTFEYSLGFAFALNYQLSLNFQVEQFITPKMTIDGVGVNGSYTNVANLKTGASWAIDKNLSMQLTTSYGLTEDSPDFAIEVSFPYTF